MEFLGLDGTLGLLLYIMVCGLMVFAVIIILSLPAALLYRGLHKVVRWSVRASRDFLRMCRNHIQQFPERIAAAFEQLKGDTNVFIFSNNEKLYVGELRRIGKNITKSTSSIQDHNRTLLGAMSDLNNGMDAYRTSLKEVPQFSKIAADYGDQSVQMAKDKSAVRWALFFVLVAAIVNTLLLGTAFDELLPRIPIPGLEVLLPLGFVVAAIYTLMEFGIGFLLAMFTGFARAVFILVAVALIVAEVGVFSRMATNMVATENANSLFGMLETYGLLGLGMAVPTVLIGMGYVWKSAQQRVKGAKAVLTLKRDVDRANKLVDEMPGRVQRISAQADSSVEALDAFRNNLGEGENAPRISQEIQSSIADLHANVEKAMSARRDGYAEADENARTRAAFGALFTAGAIVVLIVFHIAVFQFMGFANLEFAAWVLGALTAAIALSLGMFLMRRVVMGRISDTGDADISEGADQLWVRGLLLLTLAAVLGGIFYMAYTSGRQYWLVWALILSASTVGLSLLGSRTADALGAAWFLVRTLLSTLVMALASVGWIIVQSLLFALKSVLGVVALLAAPAQWALRRLRNRNGSKRTSRTPVQIDPGAQPV